MVGFGTEKLPDEGICPAVWGVWLGFFVRRFGLVVGFLLVSGGLVLAVLGGVRGLVGGVGDGAVLVLLVQAGLEQDVLVFFEVTFTGS